MQQLLLSMYCPRCESGDPTPPLEYEGFIIWRNRSPGSTEYVFASIQDAEAWRSSASLTHFSIRRVVSTKPFTWRQSTGSCVGITLADGVYEVYPFGHDTSGPHVVALDSV